jgi:hypothetical protein
MAGDQVIQRTRPHGHSGIQANHHIQSDFFSFFLAPPLLVKTTKKQKCDINLLFRHPSKEA